MGNEPLKSSKNKSLKNRETSNTIKTAVALSYEVEKGAPTVVASGKGYVADKIIEKAKAANVPLHEDSRLAQTLSKLEIGDAIPPELYSVVAEILVFVDDMEKLKKKVNFKG